MSTTTSAAGSGALDTAVAPPPFSVTEPSVIANSGVAWDRPAEPPIAIEPVHSQAALESLASGTVQNSQLPKTHC